MSEDNQESEVKRIEQLLKMVETRKCPICGETLNASISFAGNYYLNCNDYGYGDNDHSFRFDWSPMMGAMPTWMAEGIEYKRLKNADAMRHFPPSAIRFANQAIDSISIGDTPSDFIAHLQKQLRNAKKRSI